MINNLVNLLILFFLSSLNANSESVNRLEIPNNVKDEVKDERVIGGRDALPGECPYQIALLANNRFICGGFFIRQNAVVTAAHCVDGAVNTTFIVRYNTLQYNSGPTIDVKKAIVHPSYSRRTNLNDIAVLVLNSSFVRDQNANTVDISQSLDPQTNTKVTVSGWGRISVSSNAVSDTLKVANLTVMSRATCIARWTPLQISSRMICAMDNTRSACNGDSGGPLIQNGKIVGIVSFGSSQCLNDRLPNVYTRVSSYASWISSTLTRNAKS